MSTPGWGLRYWSNQMLDLASNNFCHSHFVFSFFVQPRQTTLSAPGGVPTPTFFSVHHFRHCSVLMATQLWMRTAVLILTSQVQPGYEKSVTCVCVGSVVCAGCPLLQRVQAEIRLLQEETEETSKDKTLTSLPLNSNRMFLGCLWLTRCFVFFPRLTFPTDLKWSYTGTTSLKSLTGVSCPWRGLTSWRLGCGLSLSLRKDWTMGAWPESGSSSYPKRCSTLITAYLNTLPRKLLIICALAWDSETSSCCTFIQTFYTTRHTGGLWFCFSSQAATPTNDCC